MSEICSHREENVIGATSIRTPCSDQMTSLNFVVIDTVCVTAVTADAASH